MNAELQFLPLARKLTETFTLVSSYGKSNGETKVILEGALANVLRNEWMHMKAEEEAENFEHVLSIQDLAKRIHKEFTDAYHSQHTLSYFENYLEIELTKYLHDFIKQEVDCGECNIYVSAYRCKDCQRPMIDEIKKEVQNASDAQSERLQMQKQYHEYVSEIEHQLRVFNCEHEKLIALMKQAGFDTKTMEDSLKESKDKIARMSALEHLTALMAENEEHA